MKMFEYNFFLVFLLGHFTGDFLLQTGKLAKLKAEKVSGVAKHTGLVCAAQVLLLGIFGWRGIASGILAAAAHFFLDYFKLKSGKRFQKLQSFYFLLDQLAHVGVMILLTFLFGTGSERVETHIGLIKLFIAIVMVMSVSTVAVKLFIRDFFPESAGKVFFEKFEREMDAAASLILWAGCYLGILPGAATALSAFFLYQILQTRFYRYDISVISIKFVLLAAISCTVFVWLA